MNHLFHVSFSYSEYMVMPMEEPLDGLHVL
jgi:hypothetical protein